MTIQWRYSTAYEVYSDGLGEARHQPDVFRGPLLSTNSLDFYWMDIMEWLEWHKSYIRWRSQKCMGVISKLMWEQNWINEPLVEVSFRTYFYSLWIHFLQWWKILKYSGREDSRHWHYFSKPSKICMILGLCIKCLLFFCLFHKSSSIHFH